MDSRVNAKTGFSRFLTVMLWVVSISFLLGGPVLYGVRFFCRELEVREGIQALERLGVPVGVGTASGRYFIMLGKTDLDDAKWARIAPYVQKVQPLESLNLSWTHITDRSADSITKCDVGVLDISHTHISTARASQMRKDMPNAWVYHESISRAEQSPGRSTEER